MPRENYPRVCAQYYVLNYLDQTMPDGKTRLRAIGSAMNFGFSIFGTVIAFGSADADGAISSLIMTSFFSAACSACIALLAFYGRNDYRQTETDGMASSQVNEALDNMQARLNKTNAITITTTELAQFTLLVLASYAAMHDDVQIDIKALRTLTTIASINSGLTTAANMAAANMLRAGEILNTVSHKLFGGSCCYFLPEGYEQLDGGDIHAQQPSCCTVL